MKIWGNTPRVSEVYNKHKAVSKTNQVSETASKKDALSISNQAKDFQTVLRTLKDVPDIRKDRVNEVSERFESGQYDIKGSDIADRIMKSAYNQQA